MSDTLARALIAIGDSTEVTILVKATLIMMVGLGATQLAGKARASVRHVLLASTFAALLLLPLRGAARSGRVHPDRCRCAPAASRGDANAGVLRLVRAVQRHLHASPSERSNVPIPTLSTVVRDWLGSRVACGSWDRWACRCGSSAAFDASPIRGANGIDSSTRSPLSSAFARGVARAA